MSHAVTTNFAVGDFDAATFASDTAVTYTLVLAAIALPILGWTKDTLAKETVFFRLERPVVDRLRFGNLTVRPTENSLRRSNADLYVVKAVNTRSHLLTDLQQHGRPSPVHHWFPIVQFKKDQQDLSIPHTHIKFLPVNRPRLHRPPLPPVLFPR